MVPGDNDDRPKKSWRERDNARNHSAHRRDDKPSEQAQRQQSSQAYRAYKTQLNRLFDGGVVPDALKSKLDDAEVGVGANARKEAMASVKAAATPRALVKAVAEFRTTYGFPDDEEVLARLLELDDEAALVLEAVQTLARLHAEAKLKRAAALKMRLKTALLTIDDPDVQQAILGFQAKLG